MELLKKYALVALALLLLFPTAVTFGHIFSHHEHQVCDNIDTHIHEQSIDCDIIKFKPTPVLAFEFLNFSIQEPVYLFQIHPDTYQFLSDYQKLAFALRGPPELST